MLLDSAISFAQEMSKCQTILLHLKDVLILLKFECQKYIVLNKNTLGITDGAGLHDRALAIKSKKMAPKNSICKEKFK